MASPAKGAHAARALRDAGVSPWFDTISRGLLESGELARMVREGWITGVTSNPTIFEKAVAGSLDYDAALATIAARGRTDPYTAFVELAVADIRAACDVLRPVYDATDAADGYVSFEVPPGVEIDAAATQAEAERLFALVDRPNLMIKVPGTPEGIRAFEALTAAGVNVNVTLLFGIAAYEATAEAYLRGLERRVTAGLPMGRVASVASFFVSRVDTAVDAQLPDGSPLRGLAALANARAAYARFLAIFSGERWERLAAAGAMVQRPLWASTGTKNAAYSDVLYVDGLVAPHTVNTMPEATLRAFLDHGAVAPTIVPKLDEAAAQLDALRAAGIDMVAVTDRLLVEGLASFERDFLALLARIDRRLATVRTGRGEGALGPAVAVRLETLDRDEVVRRAWAFDHTPWRPDPTELADRLGWLFVADEMVAEAADLREFAAAVAADGLDTAVLLGMGGSSLAPEVIRATFGVAPGALELHVLDTTNPRQIAALEAEIDLSRTLFVVSSKSGGTIETRTQFDYFWAKLPEGRHYAIVTDGGSALDRLGQERGVRRIFRNRPDIGGRYSALSFFGLVPAALVGADLDELLAGAHEAALACRPGAPAAENPGAWLGAVLGEAALAGRDKLTLVLPPELAALGVWVEQLVAESTGKHGRGILPVEGEVLGSPEAYGDDRLFVAIGEHPGLAALEAGGHPVVHLPYRGPDQLGAEFFRWEFATAIAGQVLGINPFDQPNVQEAKETANRMLAGESVEAVPSPLSGVLASVRPGDYIAILAYLPRDAANEERLAAVRLALRDRFGVVVTVGFGPRYLHSTGQLHKGGPDTGVFIEVVEDGVPDLPIPGHTFTFGQLNAAQALGDLASLRERGRRAARVTLADLERAV